MVPLIQNMPVAMTDHIDRNPETQIMRGKVGFLYSWVLGDGEASGFENGTRLLQKLPKVVRVKFHNTDGTEVEWAVPGLTEPGLYPILPRRGTWFVDKGRRHPGLKIARRQLPLAPAFAMTTHASQGQASKRCAIVDLRVGGSTSPIASYVAMMRVEPRKDLLIYTPFARETFTKGQGKGPELLLRVLRGEPVDWKQIEEEHMPSKCCNGCFCTV